MKTENEIIKKPRLTKEEREKIKIKEEIKAEKLKARLEIKAKKAQDIFDKNDEAYLNENPWYYKGEIFKSELLYTDEFKDNIHGFIYIIEEISTGKIYIGQKHLWTTKVTSINKKKKKQKVESDWKNYYGSSGYINDKIEKEGTFDFKRYIIALCISDGNLNYIEAKIQFDLRVLEYQDKYINGYIGGRMAASHTKYNQLLDADYIKIDELYKQTYFGFKHP